LSCFFSDFSRTATVLAFDDEDPFCHEEFRERNKGRRAGNWEINPCLFKAPSVQAPSVDAPDVR
jgi:hypothetical protein